MSEQLVFDYFYGEEAEMFSFFRIPRLLVKDPHFSDLSIDAKFLYGLMLDRMSMSIKNEWQDKEGKTFIRYTIKQIAEDLGCSESKAGRVLAELDTKKGIGLVERVRIGLSHPDIIYVKNFVHVKVVEDKMEEEKSENHRNFAEVAKCNFKKSQNGNSRNSIMGFQEVANEEHKKFQNDTTRNSKQQLQEALNEDYKKFQNDITRSPQMELHEVAEKGPNYIENNYMDSSYIDNELYPSFNLSKMFGADEIDRWRRVIKSNIEYDYLIKTSPTCVKNLDELIDLMVEVIVTKGKYVSIGKREVPRALVVERFLKCDFSIMSHVLSSLSEVKKKRTNTYGYALATLFNTLGTIENYYSAEANYDMNNSC